MKDALPRRHFLKACSLGIAGLGTIGPAAFAIEPFKRSKPVRLQLSLAAYSFRKFFSAGTLNLFQFVDYCAEHGCVGTELTSYYFPEDLDEAFLLKIRRHAYLRGIAISGTAVRNTFTYPPGAKRDKEIAWVKQWVDHAALMGAPHIRIFTGRAQQGVSMAESKKLCISAIEECGDYASKKGIFLGIENHGGIVAEVQDLLDIVRAVQSPWVGINLDTGNFHSDDPYRDLAACAPYAVNVQVKVEVRRGDAPKEKTDLARIVKLLRDAQYQGYVALEYEAKEDPWQAVPRWLEAMQEAFSA